MIYLAVIIVNLQITQAMININYGSLQPIIKPFYTFFEKLH